MKIHITRIYNYVGTAMQAQHKVAEVAKEMGFHEMGLYYYASETDSDQELSKRIDGILASLQFGDIVFIQSPSWNYMRYDRMLIRKIKAYPGVKVAVFVHDIIPILFNAPKESLLETIDIYNYADLIILPSNAALKILKENGLKVDKVIIQKMFDYPVDVELEEQKFIKRMFFTGAPSRFTFVYDWNKKTPLVLYSSEKITESNVNIESREYRKETKLLVEMSEGGFGLVWPSKSENNSYNIVQPYKVGNYLAAGIPVIIKKGLVNEEIILNNGLGFAVDTLEEADEIVSNMTEEEYNKMVNRISEFNFLIKDGWFTKKLLTDAVVSLLDNTSDNKV